MTAPPTMPLRKRTKNGAEKPKQRRKRRAPEQIVADLEAEIERVKARATAKEAESSAKGKLFLAAVKAVDKATEGARDEGDDGMVRALESARAALGEQLVRMGRRPPARSSRRRSRGSASND